MVRCFLVQEESERRRDTIRMENLYYECIYDVLWDTARHEENMTKHNHLKAKITNVHVSRLQGLMLVNGEPNRLAGERPALIHIIQMPKRRGARMIQSVQDDHGNTQRTIESFMWSFTNFLRRKYEPVTVDGECVAYMTEMGRRELPTTWRNQVERPISPEEVNFAVRKGTKKSASE